MPIPSRREPRVRTRLCIVLAALVLQGCATTHVLDRRWIEVRSEHFVITSEMSRAKTEELARSLELFRAAVLLLVGARSIEPSLPTRVYFFDSEEAFRPFRPDPQLVGFTAQSLRANYLAIVDVVNTDTARTLRHEYVHFLVQNRETRTNPMWYDEGFAELLSTATRIDGYVAIGALPVARVHQLRVSRWIPLADILTYDGTQGWTPEQEAMFYAEAWLLVHYLARDLDGARSLAPSITEYMERVETGAPIGEAWESAFGMTIEQLDASVRQYLQRGSFTQLGVREDRLEWSEATKGRVPTRPEVAELLAELALVNGRPDLAEDLLRVALETGPGFARARSTLGVALAALDRRDEADEQFERALVLGADDPLNQLDYADDRLGRAAATENPAERAAYVDQAIPTLQRAIDLDATKPEGHAMLGRAYLLEGGDVARAIGPLERARALLPANTRIQLWLAEAYAKAGRLTEARRLLTRIAQWGHGDDTSVHARALLARLDDHGDVTGEGSGSN